VSILEVTCATTIAVVLALQYRWYRQTKIHKQEELRWSRNEIERLRKVGHDLNREFQACQRRAQRAEREVQEERSKRERVQKAGHTLLEAVQTPEQAEVPGPVKTAWERLSEG